MHRLLRIAAIAAAASLMAPPLGAVELALAPGADLQRAVADAAAGDTLVLQSGVHRGPLVIDKRLIVRGMPGAVLDGAGRGSVITLTAPDVRIESLTVRGSGTDVPAMDSGVLVTKTAARAVIVDNKLDRNLFGVYLHGAADSLVERNRIRGRQDLRVSERGNGVSIWNAPGAEVIGNDIRQVRDGIFVNVSKRNVFKDNTVSEARFAIHYMYTHDSKVIGNRSEGNHVGWAIMYSERLEIRDNASIDDRDHGLMLNYANHSTITGNVVKGGHEKCLFIYNAHHNVIEDNWFEGCPIGIHFTAGSEHNTISGNAFIRNRTQVKYVGTRLVEWTHDGRGNYWSDNAAFDLNNDGVADRPYRPNDVMDEILWRYPQAKALLNSPAFDMLRLAQSRFPALYPGGVIDTAPLMAPPRMPPGEAP
jgi:nitrous oxidase accessory protein